MTYVETICAIGDTDATLALHLNRVWEADTDYDYELVSVLPVWKQGYFHPEPGTYHCIWKRTYRPHTVGEGIIRHHPPINLPNEILP